MRVAVAAKVFIDWSGGVDFILYLANSLADDPDNKVFFVVPNNHGPLDFRIETADDQKKYIPTLREVVLPAKKVKMTPDIREALADLDKRITIKTYRNNPKDFIKALKKIRADVVLPTTSSLGPKFPIPWVGYIWDFQHKYFPAYFDANELKTRDIIFSHTLDDAASIIVNSRSTENDIRKFLPKYKNTKKIFALPFCPYPLSSWIKYDSAIAAKKYNIDYEYFIVCNQFWLHKSHTTVIKAMAKLIEEDPSIHLVLTGKMEEPRDPGYIDRIKKMIEDLHLSQNLHLMGFVSKEDQIGLMRGALAVIQPTLYEGGPGGGAAYNALALGVPLIISDIEINREIADPRVTFFKAGSATDLALKLKNSLKGKRQEPSNTELLKIGKLRRKELSGALNKAIENAVKVG